MGALGSPAVTCILGTTQALISVVLATARLNQGKKRAVFESSARLFYTRGLVPNQACALLEWLLEGDLDYPREYVLKDAIFYEQAEIGNMVPVAILRVLSRLLHQVMPTRVLYLNESEALGIIMLAKSQSQQEARATSGGSVSSLTLGRVMSVTKIIRCMPAGFISRYMWRKWLPGCLSLLLSCVWCAEDLPSLVVCLENLYAVGFCSAVSCNGPNSEDHLILWAAVGASLACRKLVNSYSPLFYEDIFWLVSSFTKTSLLGAPPRNLYAFKSVLNYSREMLSRAEAVMVYLLQYNSYALKVGLRNNVPRILPSEYTFSMNWHSQKPIRRRGTEDNLVKYFEIKVTQANQLGTFYKISQRMSKLTAAIFNMSRSETQALQCEICRAVLSKSREKLNGVIFLRALKCIRFASTIRRSSRHEAATTTSLCVVCLLPLPLLECPNSAYLVVNSISSISDSLIFNTRTAVASHAVQTYAIKLQAKLWLSQHTKSIFVSTTSLSGCSLEKWITSAKQRFQDSTLDKCSATVFFGPCFVLEMMHRHIRCCFETIPLLLSYTRSWFRVAIYVDNRFAQLLANTRGLLAITQLHQLWTEGRLGAYGPALEIDSISRSRLSPYSCEFKLVNSLALDFRLKWDNHILETCLFRI